MAPTHVDLFSGIAGFALAARETGFVTVAFVESEPFCRRVLRHNFPGVPIHADVRTFTGDDVGGPIDLLTGGFPCQPTSLAGQRRGAEDDRWLWPEMARIVGEVRPRWVVAENPAGLISLGLDDCLSDLALLGYEAWPVVIPAAGVGAWHRRSRVWILAHRNGERHIEPVEPLRSGRDAAVAGGADDAHGHGPRQQQPVRSGQEERERSGDDCPGGLHADGAGGGVRRARPSGPARFAAGVREVPANAARQSERKSPDDADAVATRWAARNEPGRCGLSANASPLGDPAGLSESPQRQEGIAGVVDDGCRERGDDRSRDDADGPESGMGCGVHGLPAGMVGRWSGAWEAGLPRTHRRPTKRAEQAYRANQLKALGNAIVPQVAYVILSEIAAIERSAE